MLQADTAAWANRQFLEYFGQSLEWVKNWETNDAVHPEDFLRVAESFKRAIASEIPRCGSGTWSTGS